MDVNSHEQRKWVLNYVSTKVNNGNPFDVFNTLSRAGKGIHSKLLDMCQSGTLLESEHRPLCVMRNAWNTKVRREIEKKQGLKTIPLEVSKANFDKLTRQAKQSGISKKQLMNDFISGSFQQREKYDHEIAKMKEDRKGRAESNRMINSKFSHMNSKLKNEISTKNAKIDELEKSLEKMTSQIKDLQEQVESTTSALGIQKELIRLNDASNN